MRYIIIYKDLIWDFLKYLYIFLDIDAYQNSYYNEPINLWQLFSPLYILYIAKICALTVHIEKGYALFINQIMHPPYC